MDKEVAQFCLMNATASYQNNTKSYFTWNNINLQTLLGDMWNRYSRFKLCCYAITSYSGVNIPYDEAVSSVYLSGLPLEYPYYNPKTNLLTNEAHIATIALVGYSQQQSVFPTIDGIIFRKEQNLANINIELRRSKDDTNTYSAILGSFAFNFIVYGVEE